MTFDFLVLLVISPVVTFEYMFQIFGRNTESVVFYPDLQMPGIRFGTGDLYLHLLAGVFEGIVDKILEDGKQKMIISCNDRVFRPEVDLNIDLFACSNDRVVPMLPAFRGDRFPGYLVVIRGHP